MNENRKKIQEKKFKILLSKLKNESMEEYRPKAKTLPPTCIRSLYLSSVTTDEPDTFFASTIVFKSARSVMCLDMSVARTISMTIFRNV